MCFCSCAVVRLVGAFIPVWSPLAFFVLGFPLRPVLPSLSHKRGDDTLPVNSIPGPPFAPDKPVAMETRYRFGDGAKVSSWEKGGDVTMTKN